MNSPKIVEGLPIYQVWDRKGNDLPNRRENEIGREEADLLIINESPRIVLVQVAAPLMWMKPENNLSFWKRTPKSAYYFTANDHNEILDKSIKPNFIFYASTWGLFGSSPLLVMEMVCWPSGDKSFQILDLCGNQRTARIFP